ncbi:MAG: hypothetical protein KDK27_06155 [Leptospiraceae bacterium]|nr:hypothetical protein [Leptospiraceae bacterium]
MSSASAYKWIGAGAFLILILLVLFGPLDEPDENESVLWHSDWAVIEVEPLMEDDEATGESAELDSHSSTDRNDPVATARDAWPEIDLRMIRNAGFFRDEYFAETPMGGRPGADMIRFRGNFNVQNAFTDSRSPKLVAYYSATPEQLESCGLNTPSARIKFYESADAEPIIVSVGRLNPTTNNYFVSTTYPELADYILVVPSVWLQKFKYDYLQYRDKRLLEYPTDSYTEAIEIEGEHSPFRIEQERKPPAEENQPPEIKWFYVADERRTEIPNLLGNSVDGMIKQIQITHFADEPEFNELPSVQEQWEAAELDYLKVSVEITDTDRREFRIRLAHSGAVVNEQPMMLIQPAGAEHIHYIQARTIEDLRKHARSVFAHLDEVRRQQSEQETVPVLPGRQ